MIVVALVGLVVSILVGYWLADLGYTWAARPEPRFPPDGVYHGGPTPEGEPPIPALFTRQPLTTPLMRKMEGLHQAINAGLLTPEEAREMRPPPDVSWIGFEKVRR
jgi:hypothetical protein